MSIKNRPLSFRKSINYGEAIRRSKELLENFQEVAFFYDPKQDDKSYISQIYRSIESGIMKKIKQQRFHPNGLTIVQNDELIHNSHNLWGGIGKLLKVIPYDKDMPFREIKETSIDLRLVNGKNADFVRELFKRVGKISILRSEIDYLKEKGNNDDIKIDWGFNKSLSLLLNIGDVIKLEPFLSIKNKVFGKRLFTPSLRYSKGVKEALLITKEKKEDTYFQFNDEKEEKIKQIEIGKHKPFTPTEEGKNGVFIAHYLKNSLPFYLTYNDLISGIGRFLKVGCYNPKFDRFIVKGLDLRLKTKKNINKIKDLFLKGKKASVINKINTDIGKDGVSVKTLMERLKSKMKEFDDFWNKQPVKKTLSNTISLIDNRIFSQNTLMDF
jgi:hypothetical protein